MTSILCSVGWCELLWMMLFVVMGFLYMSYSILLDFIIIVRSKKFIELSFSFSIVNCSFRFIPLNQLKVLLISVIWLL
jgi:hypothetical protein